MQWLSVALGGALGALSRYAVTLYLPVTSINKFPFATLLVNVLGSLTMGILYVILVERAQFSPQMHYFLTVGFLGAFTTYSTFSLDALSLWQNGGHIMAAVYVISTVVLCLLAVIGAVWLTRLI